MSRPCMGMEHGILGAVRSALPIFEDEVPKAAASPSEPSSSKVFLEYATVYKQSPNGLSPPSLLPTYLLKFYIPLTLLTLLEERKKRWHFELSIEIEGVTFMGFVENLFTQRNEK